MTAERVNDFDTAGVEVLDEKREEYYPHVRPGNLIISAQKKPRGGWQSSQVIQPIACLDLIDRGSSNFPSETYDVVTNSFKPNVSASLLGWLAERDLNPADLFAHIVATLNAPSYAKGNAGALRVDWPRIPIPYDTDVFTESASVGAKIAGLIDSETPVQGVTTGALLAGLADIAVPTGKDYSAIGWGYAQAGRTGSTIVMPRPGTIVSRPWTPQENDALTAIGTRHDIDIETVHEVIGKTACDIYLNGSTYWRAVPERVW